MAEKAPPPEPARERLVVYLSPKVKARIVEIAKGTKRTASGYVEFWLEEHIASLPRKKGKSNG